MKKSHADQNPLLLGNYLNDQRKRNIEETPFKREICSTAFSDFSELTMYMTQDGQESYECYFCLSNFDEENKLIEHTKSHTGETFSKSGKTFKR